MTDSGLTDTEQWIVRSAFKEHVEKCAQVALKVFDMPGSEVVELQSWLYDSAVTPSGMADTVHTEPVYLVADFLGTDTKSADFVDKEQHYIRLAEERGWITA